MSVLLLSINRLLQSLKNGFCQKVKKGELYVKFKEKNSETKYQLHYFYLKF